MYSITESTHSLKSFPSSHGNLLRQGSDVSHGSGIVKLKALVQPSNLLEDTQLISHLLLHLVPDILDSGALLLSLTLTLALSLAPPSACSRTIFTLSCGRLKLGTNGGADSAHGNNLVILEAEAGGKGDGGGCENNEGLHDKAE